MRLFISGGSGFVGQAVLEHALDCGHEVHALVHRKPLVSPNGLGDPAKIRSFPGGLFDPAAVDAAMQGCDVAIHLVGIIREIPSRQITFDRMHVQATAAVLESARRCGVKRHVQMSALGARPDAAAEYHRTKLAAEELVRKFDGAWTILRPSMIHGPRGEFMKMVAGWIRMKQPPFLFMPFFGKGLLGIGGAGQIQPIFVEDVARAVIESAERAALAGHCVEMGGPQPMTWPAFYRLCADVIVSHRRWIMPIPAWLARWMTRLPGSSILPFTHDQVVMSTEDNTCDLLPFSQLFPWMPRSLTTTLREYAGQL